MIHLQDSAVVRILHIVSAFYRILSHSALIMRNGRILQNFAGNVASVLFHSQIQWITTIFWPYERTNYAYSSNVAGILRDLSVLTEAIHILAGIPLKKPIGFLRNKRHLEQFIIIISGDEAEVGHIIAHCRDACRFSRGSDPV